ncbi:carboxypeptidase regulatory-like domain-containing protein [Spirosoma sp. BT702]|uniref:Carboxypeptidase regulatory-like domain-containing protein n=1 Tax=Spirosoma profusum TaxID=2771354 RepID=A0A927AWH5_9BACT|nr:carboxypeptidase-like regulatory domain-containing protein [Spirosoma profusum]MBD2705674.1 carboxypeptidase regulatory-like domain-containing protein [Spirosoma profusum]
MKSLSIQIPKACHERWEEMQPAERGRFCANCRKVVVDYTALSDKELMAVFQKTSAPGCGRFRNDQLNCFINPARQNLSGWRHWISFLAAGILGLQTVRAQSNQTNSFAERTTTPKNSLRPIIPDIPPIKSSSDTDMSWTVSGRFMRSDSAGNVSPVAQAHVTIGQTGKTWQTRTDSTGSFSLSVSGKRRITEFAIWCSNTGRLHAKTTFSASPLSPSIVLEDIVAYEPEHMRDITGGGIVLIRKPSRLKVWMRKLFQ